MFTGSLMQYILAFIVIIVTIFYVYLRRNFNYWKSRGVRYEEPNILVGNVSFLMRKSFSEYFYELSRKFPYDYFGIYLGWNPALIVQTPELAKKVLTKDFENFQNRMSYSNYESDPLGALNLFTVKNPTWSQVRHELSPMFTSLRLKSVTELMNGNARELVLKIQRDFINENKPVNLKELFSMYTSDTVGSTVFGIKVSALNDPSSPLWHITQYMVHWTFWRGFELTMIFMIPAVAAFLRLKFFSKPATDYIKKLFWTVAKDRETAGHNSNDKDLVNHLLQLKRNLKLPVEAGTQMADDLMIAQAAVFILGSIETSSTTLTYCLHEMAQHPEEQQKLFDEINGALKRTGKDILEYDDLVELKYLTACILETLRKYPPVPHLDRMCNQTYKLNDDVTIEKGTPVFVNVLALHYDEKVFPEPQKWRPDRMYGVYETDNLNCSLLPFGDGPRFCIGKRYGVMQIRAAIAQMITKYRIERDPSAPLQLKSDPFSVMLAPMDGGRVKFVPR